MYFLQSDIIYATVYNYGNQLDYGSDYIFGYRCKQQRSQFLCSNNRCVEFFTRTCCFYTFCNETTGVEFNQKKVCLEVKLIIIKSYL